MGRIATAGLAGIALTLCLVACGGEGRPSDELREAAARKFLCNPPGRTIKLHNSGISCEQAGASLLLRPAGLEGPQVVHDGSGGEWICRELSGDGRPSVFKCSQGERFYTIESERRER